VATSLSIRVCFGSARIVDENQGQIWRDNINKFAHTHSANWQAD